MALGHEFLPETCLCRLWSHRLPLECSRLGRENYYLSQAPLPRGQQRDESLLPSCRRVRVFPISSRQAVWLHGFPIHQTAAAQTRYVVTCSSTGFTVSRFTSREHHVCNSGPVSLHDQAVAPAVGSGRLHRTNQAFKTWSLETLNCLFGI